MQYSQNISAVITLSKSSSFKSIDGQVSALAAVFMVMKLCQANSDFLKHKELVMYATSAFIYIHIKYSNGSIGS